MDRGRSTVLKEAARAFALRFESLNDCDSLSVCKGEKWRTDERNFITTRVRGKEDGETPPEGFGADSGVWKRTVVCG